jgi:uncharacterized protein
MTDKDTLRQGLADASGTQAPASHTGSSMDTNPVQSVDPTAAAQDDDMKEPPSPCVSVCALDENDLCMGCYRTASEITDWFMASPTEKHAILRAAEERRRADSPIRLL